MIKVAGLGKRVSSPGKVARSICLGMMALILLVAAGQHSLAQEPGWTTPVMISTNTVSSWFSDVAVDDWGRPHVIWNSGRATEGELMDLLMYSTPTDEGWLEPNDIELTAYGGYTIRPAVAVDRAAILHATFRGELTVYYTRAPASEAWNAASWSPRQSISGAGIGSAYYSDVAVDEQDGVHIVWNEGVSAGVGERWLWFGTPQGAFLHDGRDWRLQEPQAGMGEFVIRAMIEDEAGVQWFGTDDGVYRFDGSTWQGLTRQDGLVAQKVNCVTADAERRLWLGTDSGVSVYDEEARPDEPTWNAYAVGTGLPGNTVHAIATDHLGRVWVGTENGVARYDDQGWVSFSSVDGLVADEVLAIAVSDRDDVWVGTGQGVGRYDGERWMTYTVDSGLISNAVTAIVVDREDTIWVGTDRGVSRFDGLGWTSYAAGEGPMDGSVTALMVDREGKLWVGSGTGVSTYDGQAWARFELPPEFAGQPITAITEDRQVNAMCYLCADIFYRHSTDGGHSWAVPVNLSNSFAGSIKPQVQVGSGSNVYVTWEEGEDWYTHGGYPVSSMFVYSPDGGNTWTEPIGFSSSIGPPQQITLGVGQEGNLVAVWRPSGQDLLPEQDRFYYQVSADHGATWSEPRPIPGVIPKPWSSFNLDAYHTATDSAGHVHLLVLGYLYSAEEDLGLMHLVWNGSEWSAPSRIYASKDPPEWPRIDVGAGNQVYATWFTRDERHVADTDGSRYRVWVSVYQASAPSQTPVPLPTPTPPPAVDALGQAISTPIPTPPPFIDPATSGLPPGLYTESDEIGRLLVALSPVAVILLGVLALRLGRPRRYG